MKRSHDTIVCDAGDDLTAPRLDISLFAANTVSLTTHVSPSSSSTSTTLPTPLEHSPASFSSSRTLPGPPSSSATLAVKPTKPTATQDPTVFLHVASYQSICGRTAETEKP